jgi:hypothetical protein
LIHLGARATAEYPFVAIGDGATVTLGAVCLVALENSTFRRHIHALAAADPC